MKRSNQGTQYIAAAQRAIDIWIAILLLTGQLTIGGVFVAYGSIWFSLTGTIFGSVRTEGETPNANVVVDAIDIITALLLILGLITNTGPWISSGRFNMVVTGPVFGYDEVPVPINSSKISKKAQEFCNDFTEQIIVREMKKKRSNH